MAAPRSLLDGDKLNLERINFLLVDDNVQSLDITAQVIHGFGVRNVIKCTSAAEAKSLLSKSAVDFVVTDARMPEEDGYSLVEWIRTEPTASNRYIPVIVVTAHTPRGEVKRGRDCGAHFVVLKPLTPRVLLERIFWIAQDERNFVECDAYVGPDRRFKREGPPPNTEGRRADDLSGKLGDPSEPNLSQADIDAFMKPAKVTL